MEVQEVVQTKPYGLERFKLNDPIVQPQEADTVFIRSKMAESGIRFHNDIPDFPIEVSDEIQSKAQSANPLAEYFITFLNTPFMEYPSEVDTTGNDGIAKFEEKFHAGYIVEPRNITDEEIEQTRKSIAEQKQAAEKKNKTVGAGLIGSIDFDALSPDIQKQLAADIINERRYLAAERILNSENRWKVNAFRDVLSVLPLMTEMVDDADMNADLKKVLDLLPRISPDLEAGERASDFYKEIPKEAKLRIQKQYAKAAASVLHILAGEGVREDDLELIQSLRVPIGEERRKMLGMP